ncbi:type VII secretion integral membrane protein EccD [Mycolicibacterium fortuitum]|uniref:Type VII secretion integral membrane protein EccD n=1 Tax=Mycolicibacterium fortuitum TaxID=1766 RepID=A0A378WE67_MYCFO|nr:type VII secretion integral membrane protein EccD [Mycolicibacterium fortuitum]
MFALYRAVGTGHWGFLSGGVFFGLCAVALIVHQLGVRVDIVGSALAIVGTFGCLTVPRLTAALAYSTPAKAQAQSQREEPLFENPSKRSLPASRQVTLTATRRNRADRHPPQRMCGTGSAPHG